MTKLLMTLHTKYKWDNLAFPLAVCEALLIMLCITSEHKIFFIAISIITFIPIAFDWKALFLLCVVLTVVLVVYFIQQPSQPQGKELSGKFKVERVTSLGPVIFDGKNNVLLKTFTKLNQWDEIEVKGMLSKTYNNSDFDLKTYLKSLNIFYMIENPKINLLGTSNDFRIKAKEYLSSGEINYRMVTPLIFLGNKNKDTKFLYDASLKMNVVHLFVISGFHISLIYSLLFKGLKLIRVKNDYAAWIALLPIWAYLFVLDFPISASRAVILTTLLVINKEIFNKRFDSMQVLAIAMAIIISWKPMSIYSLSFIFTFIATFTVVFINGIEFKSKNIKYISIVIGAYLSNVLITVYVNHSFSVFGLIFGIALTPPFVIVYLLTILLFPIKPLLNYIDYGFIWVIKVFNNINLMVSAPKFDFEWLCGLYGAIWCGLIGLASSNNNLFIKSLIWKIKWSN